MTYHDRINAYRVRLSAEQIALALMQPCCNCGGSPSSIDGSGYGFSAFCDCWSVSDDGGKCVMVGPQAWGRTLEELVNDWNEHCTRGGLHDRGGV